MFNLLKNTYLWVFILLGATGCTQKGEVPPIPVSKMQEILLDLHLADNYSTGLGLDSIRHRYDKNKDSLAWYYSSILNHYQLEYDQLVEAIKWYNNHPEYLDSVYLQVISSLEMIKQNNNALDSLEKVEEGIPVNDSVLKKMEIDTAIKKIAPTVIRKA